MRLFTLVLLSLSLIFTAHVYGQGIPPAAAAAMKKRIAMLTASINKKLPVAQQKQTYYQIVVAEQKAYKTSRAKYPTVSGTADMLQRSSYERTLREQYRAVVTTANHLTVDEGDMLERIGQTKKWPTPAPLVRPKPHGPPHFN